MSRYSVQLNEVIFTGDPETGAPKTVRRCDLSVPCSVSDCNLGSLPWRCVRCEEIVEYGTDDGVLYCNCGTIQPTACKFLCSQHGPINIKPDKLEEGLKSLQPPPDTNILVLGETGVGKSTFINNFPNYLTYHTLEDAVRGENLITLIPNEFTITDNEMECVTIRNGPQTEDENFTAGQSSTQRTKVHRFHLGSTVIRIIDTPGVGDVRGAIQDNVNFQDILNTIASFSEIHAIVVLLKPNQARLTITFRYCIEKLLMHLHKSAANNIVFGFTNTRGTNFRPGDTMPSLKKHLETHSSGIKLAKDTVYCFDSEGYRFLAGLLHGIDFDRDLFDSYSKSWDCSVRELQRLFAHIRTLKPHSTNSTLSVNNARIHILRLTKPMAEMTKLIAQNSNSIRQVARQIESLYDDSAVLAARLMGSIDDLVPEDLDYPRTVCTNSECVTVSEHNGKQFVDYTTWCHEHCYLDDLTLETTNNAALLKCAAMSNGVCKNCTHRYEEHMHITYKLNRVPKMIENEAVRKMIDANVSTRDLKNNIMSDLRSRFDELRRENLQIEKIAARFGAFLQHNSITSYNHARADYLNFLIDEEKKKKPEFRDTALIKALETSLQTYQEEVAILIKAMKDGGNSGPMDLDMIQDSINELYELKHSGSLMRDVQNSAIRSTTKSFREVSHRIAVPWYSDMFF